MLPDPGSILILLSLYNIEHSCICMVKEVCTLYSFDTIEDEVTQARSRRPLQSIIVISSDTYLHGHARIPYTHIHRYYSHDQALNTQAKREMLSPRICVLCSSTPVNRLHSFAARCEDAAEAPIERIVGSLLGRCDDQKSIWPSSQ